MVCHHSQDDRYIHDSLFSLIVLLRDGECGPTALRSSRGMDIFYETLNQLLSKLKESNIFLCLFVCIMYEFTTVMSSIQKKTFSTTSL